MDSEKSKGHERSVYIVLLSVALSSLVLIGLLSWIVTPESKSDAFLQTVVINLIGFLINLAGFFFSLVIYFYLVQKYLRYDPQSDRAKKILDSLDDLYKELINYFKERSQQQEAQKSLQIIVGRDNVYNAFLEAQQALNPQEIKSTALGGRSELTNEIGNFLAATVEGINQGSIISHEKVVKITTLKELEACEALLKKREEIKENLPDDDEDKERFRDKFDIRYIKPEDFAALDILIFDDKEIWIAFPPSPGDNNLDAAIGIKNSEITKEIVRWFTYFLFKRSHPLDKAALSRIRQELENQQC